MVPDYYAMLEVDPRADQQAIEAAIDRGRHKWSSGTRNPKYKHTYQSYLDQVPEIRRRLLGGPATRAAYDADRGADLAEAKGRTLDELQRLVRLRAAKGGLSETDRRLLLDRAVGLGLAEDDLARLVEPYPRSAETPAEPVPRDDRDEPSGATLDPVTRRQIGAALDLVGRRDLYHALALARDASPAEVTGRADAERQAWMRKSQVTAEKTAWLEVVSYAQSHLAGAEGRSRYDRSLALDAEEDFGRSVAFALEGTATLDPATGRALVDDATRRGIAPDRASRLIARACRDSGIVQAGSVATAAPPPRGFDPPRFLRCRACGGLTAFDRVARDPDRADCRHCRASLRWACPNCRQGHWVDEVRCPCGFLLRDLEPLARHFEASQAAYRARDYDGALDHLGRVAAIAPKLAGVRKGLEKVQARLAEVEEFRLAFDREMARGALVAAREALLAWTGLVDPGSPPLLASKSEWLARHREAHAHLARARTVEAADPRAARAAYRQALALAVDLAEAREGLRRLPPDPPSGLRANLEEDAIALRWDAPPPDGLGPVTFRVVRKVGATPTGPDDGAIVTEARGTDVRDATAPGGRTLGYAVYSVRDRCVSPVGSTLTPLSASFEVADLRAEGSPGQVALGWTLPRGATAARVVRLDGPGADRPVEALAEGATDRGLDDARIYRYRISALYRGDDGGTVASPGVEIAATPMPPAAMAGPVSVRREADGRVAIGWPVVPRGTVKVLRSAAPPGPSPGTRIGSAEATRLAGAWLAADRIDGATDPDPPSVGVCHYTPFVFLNGSATAGAPAAYSSVPDPTDLRAVRAGGGRVHLRWRWTPRATESVVVARLGVPPEGPDDRSAVSTRVGEADYGRQGYASLALPVDPGPGPSGPWHLAVFSLVDLDGQTLASPGIEPTARTIVPGPTPEVTVSYALRRPTFPGRAWSIALRTDPPGSATPPLALVAHPRTVPLSADDGQIVERFPPAQDGATFPVRPRVDLARYRSRLFSDPAADPTGVPPIRLRHPESAGTRV